MNGNTYTYRGYTIIISPKTAAVLAYKAGKLAFQAATETDVEELINSSLSEL